jgi:hypothetical protein
MALKAASIAIPAWRGRAEMPCLGREEEYNRLQVANNK